MKKLPKPTTRLAVAVLERLAEIGIEPMSREGREMAALLLSGECVMWWWWGPADDRDGDYRILSETGK